MSLPTAPHAVPATASLSRLQLLALLACAGAFSFDLLEMSLGSVLSAVFSTPPHQLPGTQLAWLLSSVYVGAILGAPACGWLADRYGRRLLLAATLAWLAVASLGAFFSTGVLWLAVFRGLSGFALGAFPPLMIAYLTEVLPPARRGMLVFIVTGLASLGPPAGTFLVQALTPLQPLGLEGWRWAFAAGSVGALAAGVLFLWLPESALWERQRGRKQAADADARRWSASPTVLNFRVHARQASLPQGEPAFRTSTRLRLALVYALSFLCPWFSVGFSLVAGAVMAQKGFRLSDTLLYITVSALGPCVGALMASTVVDRVPRRGLLAVCALAMLASGAVFAAGQTLLPLAASSLVFGIFYALYLPGINLYVADLFPSQTRASAMATAWAFNRIGAALVPLVLLPVLKGAGPVVMLSLIAATLVASLVLLKFNPD